MTSPWVQTVSGKAIDLDGPRIDQLSVRDIAHHLSQINRYVGATPLPYSVAQHCVLVSSVLPAPLQLTGLCHDAPEAFTGDITSPMKRRLESFHPGIVKLAEEPTERAVAAFLGAVYPWPKEVIEADLRMLVTERRDLMGDLQVRPWGVNAEPYADVTVMPWTPSQAERFWLETFLRLGGVM